MYGRRTTTDRRWPYLRKLKDGVFGGTGRLGASASCRTENLRHTASGGPEEFGDDAAGGPEEPGQSEAFSCEEAEGGRAADHIVVVIFENKHRSSVVGNPSAPYLNKLAQHGANMTRSYGDTHPSQPNYLALFSGSTQGVTSNACLRGFEKKQNLGSQLRRAGLAFTRYAEGLPRVGFTGCVQSRYERKHNSWVNFDNLPRRSNQPFSAFPRDYRKLPTVAFVSPDMCNNMHDCSIRTGDRWMKRHSAATRNGRNATTVG